jgi:hypothetical protein
MESPTRCARGRELSRQALEDTLGILPIHDMVSKITSCEVWASQQAVESSANKSETYVMLFRKQYPRCTGASELVT